MLLKLRLPEGAPKREQVTDVVKEMLKVLKEVVKEHKIPVEIEKRVLVSGKTGGAGSSDVRDQFLIEKLTELKLDLGKLVGKESQDGFDELEDEEEDNTIFSAINHVHKSVIKP